LGKPVWNGSEKKPAEIAAKEDRFFLQVIMPEQIGFSRGISTVGRDDIVRLNDKDGGSGPQQPTD
jgi:hypothetical protein